MLCYKVVCILKWVLGKNFGVPGPSSGWPVFNCVRLRTTDHMSKLAENYVLGVGFEKESDGFE